MSELNPQSAIRNPQSALSPSRLAGLVWSCLSYDFYRRIIEDSFGRTVGYLCLLAAVSGLAVAAFFDAQALPALRSTAEAMNGLVFNGGRLVAAPDMPTVLYDDGPHGLLLVQLAVNREPLPPVRRYDAVVTLRPRGADLTLCGHRFQVAWPAGLSLDVQQFDARAFVDAWAAILDLAVFAAAFGWFLATRFVHAAAGSVLFILLAGPTRDVNLRRGFNVAAYTVTPGTLLTIGLLWAAAFYRLAPAVFDWSWVVYLIMTLLYLVGAITALPQRPVNPWLRGPRLHGQKL